MEIKYTVLNEDINKTIKEIINSKLKISHRLLITLKEKNNIFLNDLKIRNINDKVSLNDTITLSFNYDEDNSNIVPKNIQLNIIYEDEWLLILNKPASLSVHPSILHYEDSLSNGIRYYFDKINLNKKIRPVNRLDKDTSGLIVFAKCEYIQEELIKQMKNDSFLKEYTAIVEGTFDKKKRNN